jgi:peptide chain release factor 3
MEDFQKKNSTNLALDTEGNLVYLALSEWRLSHTMEEWPKVKFHKTMEKN